MTEPLDILSLEYITTANAELRTKPCPMCQKVGTASVAKEFLPSKNFSLAGVQDKLSGSFALVMTCTNCGGKARLYQ